ncbi:MAG: oligosaccharide flippase family protein [Candidatus Bathyarchaeia archaeon]
MSDSLINVAGNSARSALSLFLGDFTSTAMLTIGYILITRLLGPEGYGLHSLSLVAPTILASLIGLGLDSSTLRFSAKYKAEKKYGRVLSTLNLVLTFKLIVEMLGSLGCFLFSELLSIQLLNKPEIAPYIRIISLGVLLQTLFTFMYNSLVGLDSAEKASGIKALMSIVKTFSAPILIILGLGVTGAIFGHVIGYVVAYLGHRTISSILALALLAAITASMNSVVNYVNAQSEALANCLQE